MSDDSCRRPEEPLSLPLCSALHCTPMCPGGPQTAPRESRPKEEGEEEEEEEEERS